MKSSPVTHSKHLLRLMIIFIVGITLFTILMVVNHRIVGSDDTIFQTQILPYHNVIEWIQYRYFNWSGRIFSEGFIYLLSPAPFVIWQILNVAAYALFSGIFFLYYRLLSKDRSQTKDYVMLAIALCLPFLAHKAVLSDGITWMTGSIVYFWAAVLGLIALYPITYSLIKNRLPRIPLILLSFILAIVAILSQEQVAVSIVGLSAVFALYQVFLFFRKQRTFPWYSLLFFAIATGSFFVTYLAPGNAIRLELEMVRWLPDFQTIPLIDRVQYSYRWLLDAVVNHTGFLFALIWLVMSALFFIKANKKFVDYVFGIVLLCLSIIVFAKGAESVAYLVEFYANWKPTITNPIVALNIIPWGIALITTLIAPLVLFRDKPTFGLSIAMLLGLSISCAVIMVLSPTMYASSWRSISISSVILMFSLYLLIDRLLSEYWKVRYALLTLVITLATTHYLYQMARLIQD